MKALALTDFDGPFLFTRRPESLPAELRPQWRIGVLLLVLSVSWGKKSSLKKLHVINWAIRNDNAQENLIKYMEGELPPSMVIVRFEPGLSQALAFGQAEGLWELIGGKSIQLTTKGILAAKELEADSECFVSEKAFITRIKSHMTEQNITALLTWDEL
jgi:hypothetical protein